ncbi:MAG: ABC transporter ATP-binding protein [Mycoplasmataceae bacterium]|nr:ABC transporter ATP-binding protein [Mycoplasmataceae bacterium]
MKNLLEIKNYTKKYKKKIAVDNLTFSVKKGEFHGFIGENGAGKTTTIKAIISAYKKFDGEIKIFGVDSRKEESRKRVGYIPEVAKFPKSYTTINYLVSMAILSGMKKKDAKDKAYEIMDLLGIKELEKKFPVNFSSGQKKKVLLGQAIIHDPDILIMDEPAANLDPRARMEFFSILKKMQKQGKAIFISSHILTELDKYIDSVTIISQGKLVFSGKLDKLRGNSRDNLEDIYKELVINKLNEDEGINA